MLTNEERKWLQERGTHLYFNAKNIVSTTLEKTHILSVLIPLRYLKNGAKMMPVIRTGRMPQSSRQEWRHTSHSGAKSCHALHGQAVKRKVFWNVSHVG